MNDTGSIIFVFTMLIGAVLAALGWVLNLVWLFGNLTADFTVQTLVSILGIFVGPLGVIHGYFTVL